MLKPSCFFSNDAKTGAKVFLTGLLIASGAVLADEPASLRGNEPAPAASVSGPPVLTVHETGASSPDHQIRIGDRVTLQVELGPVDPDAAKPTLKLEDSSKKPEDSGWFIDPSTLHQGGVLRFVVSPLKGGALTLPPLILSDSGNRTLARTAPFTLTVTAPANPDTGTPDLLDVITIGLPLRYRILIALLLVACGVAAIYGYRAWKKRKRPAKPVALPALQKEPDHLIALRKLDVLFDAHPFTPENLKIVSFGVSEILKEFFSRRFGIEALEATTDEMMGLLGHNRLAPEQLREIRNLFDELDLYKFTKVESYPRLFPEIHDGLRLKAQVIIQKWAPRAAEPGVTA
jgi:hypothetical protein